MCWEAWRASPRLSARIHAGRVDSSVQARLSIAIATCSDPWVSYHGVYKHGGRKYTSRMLSRAPLHRGAREHLVVESLPTELEISLTHGQAGLVPLLSS